MFVSTDVLRTSTEISRRASTIAQRGARRVRRNGAPPRTFDDFDTARSFNDALATVHQMYATTMTGHQPEFDGLAEKADPAATTFIARDEQRSDALTVTAVPCANRR